LNFFKKKEIYPIQLKLMKNYKFYQK